MDWNMGDNGLIYLNKRGLLKRGAYGSPTGAVLQWKSKYASVTFNLVCYQLPWGGMNEKGISFSTMSLLPYVLPPVDGRPPMSGPQWAQYVLDTCEDIDEVIATTARVRLNLAEHFLFTDRHGNCAVVENVNGQLLVHSGENLPVAALANTDYSTSLSSWQNYQRGDSNYIGLDQSRRRFSKAADRVEGFSSTSDEAAIEYAFDTLDTIAGERNGGHISQWRVVFDSRNLRAWFRTFNHPVKRYIDLRRIDMSSEAPVKMLDVRRELAGDLTDDFIDFDFETSLDHYEWFCTNWGIESTPAALRRDMQIYAGHQQVEDDTSEAFLVSRNVEDVNANPRCALNPATGDLLAVWTQADDSKATTTIRSMMLMRNVAGGYTAIENHALSEGGGYCAHPFPIYIPAKDQYLVVWDEAAPAKPAAKSNVVGRIVSAGGLPEGKVFDVLSNGKRNESPHVYARDAAVSATGEKTSRARLYLVFSSVDAAGGPGLYTARLGAKYKARKPRLVLSGGVQGAGELAAGRRILPGGTGRVIAQNLVLPVVFRRIRDNSTKFDQPVVLVIDRFKSLADSEYLGAPGATHPSICMFRDSLDGVIVVGSVLQDGSVVNKAMKLSTVGKKPELSFLRQTIEQKQAVDSLVLAVTSGNLSQEIGLAPAAKKAFGYLICAAADGKVYRRRIADVGKTSGSYKEIFQHDMALNSIYGEEIFLVDKAGNPISGKTADFLILWQEKVSDDHHQIRGNLFKAPR